MAAAIKKGEFSKIGENCGQCTTKAGAAVSVANVPRVPVGRGKWHERGVSIQGLKESNSPRLRCCLSGAIVLVIVNPRHLPGGISHSSNKFPQNKPQSTPLVTSSHSIPCTCAHFWVSYISGEGLPGGSPPRSVIYLLLCCLFGKP